MSSNPYDRRRSEEERANRGGFIPDWQSIGVGHTMATRQSNIRFEDIEALVLSAQRRAHEEGREGITAAEGEARRVGWDQGHEIGLQEGEIGVLERADEALGGLVHAQLTAARVASKEFDADPRKVSKADLMEFVRAQESLLSSIVQHHHNAFRTLPF